MSLPKTPIKGDPETRRFLEAVRQKVESVENNAVTVDDMRKSGFFDRNGIDVGGETAEVQSPTVPTSLAAEGAFENIILTWDYAEYTGHNNSRIYRSLTNVFADAEVLANVEGRVYADLVGGGKTYYYWVSNVNVKNIESATSQASGVQGVTLPDTQFILNALTNSITQSQLFTSLGARINLIDGPETLIGSVNARIAALDLDITNELKGYTDAQISSSSTSLTQTFNNTLSGYVTNANLTANYYTAAGTNSAIAAATLNLATKTELGSYVTTATLTSNYYTKTGTDGAISAATQNFITASALNGYVTTATLTNNYYTASGTNNAISAATQNLVSTSTLNGYVTTATLTNGYYTKAAADSAIATSVGQVSARLNSFNGSGVTIEQNATVEASKVTGLQGQYTVKIDNNGYVSGFGLASTPVNGTPFSDFIIRADRFSISSPSGPSPIAPVTPFIVTTTTSVIDGTTVPAGVYIKSATILDGAITNAKIRNAAIDDAKIVSLDAVKITTGQLDAARITVDGVSMDTYFDASIGRNRLFIRDLGVSNGKIANLAVDTLKIAGNAVTQTLIFTAPDIFVANTITSSGGGNSCDYEFVGSGNGSYEGYFDGYEGFYYVFVGSGNGSYNYVCSTVPSSVSGGYQIIETPTITVGDSVGGALIIVFYATIDSASAKDGGQFIILQVSVNGGAYQSVVQTKVGARTNSGADTYFVMPVAVPWSVPLAQTVRVRVYTGNRHITTNAATNPTYMRNINLSLLGAKR